MARRRRTRRRRKRRRTAKPRGKLGSGARFRALKKGLKKRGARSPGALAAWIGRKKYGKKKMARMAAAGRRGKRRRRRRKR